MSNFQNITLEKLSKLQKLYENKNFDIEEEASVWLNIQILFLLLQYFDKYIDDLIANAEDGVYSSC